MTYPQRPNRKLPRLKGYDYAQEGVYFITICTYGRDHLFGAVINGQMCLNELGQIAESCWINTPEHFPHTQLDLFVIMPNHVHCILTIGDSVGKGSVKPPVDAVSHRQPEQIALPVNKPVQPGSLGAIVGSYKSAVTKQINRNMGIKAPIIWQGSYHDHIIRNEHELNVIREYVLNNPARWAEDKYYKDAHKP